MNTFFDSDANEHEHPGQEPSTLKTDRLEISGNEKTVIKYILLSLMLLTILFFVPWFSSDIDSTLLDSTNIISGIQVSKYSDMLGELAGDSLGRLFSLALTIVKYSYILPIFSVFSALLLLVHKKTGMIFSIFTSILHILIPIVFSSLPESIEEFFSLTFVVTPTIYLFGIIGSAILLLSVILLVVEKKRERLSPKKTHTKKTPARKSGKSPKKKISSNRK